MFFWGFFGGGFCPMNLTQRAFVLSGPLLSLRIAECSMQECYLHGPIDLCVGRAVMSMNSRPAYGILTMHFDFHMVLYI